MPEVRARWRSLESAVRRPEMKIPAESCVPRAAGGAATFPQGGADPLKSGAFRICPC